ncbi:hypothetical protein DXT76_19565 [Halobacillus trueperi]|uniref:Uncharacterized protein n=1 Tax=Halobacillus trueperi TaxID=156205 RepID=A0A3D8VCY6_9BACI|nr:hypothetical protein [Halobacillus trueperi]RDY67294.1 hypothetical protein DXT76_19565 [Halobacillus trueperi]
MSLKKRLKKLEAQYKGDTVTIQFVDGDEFTVSKKEFSSIWFNAPNMANNMIYQRMKTKYDEGIIDTSGLIHSMIAYDPKETEGLWDDEY